MITIAPAPETLFKDGYFCRTLAGEFSSWLKALVQEEVGGILVKIWIKYNTINF